MSQIHQLARRGQVRELKQQLMNNPNIVNKKDSWGDTALMWAIKFDQPECVHLLLGAGADIRVKANWGYTALAQAQRFGRKNIATFLENNLDN